MINPYPYRDLSLKDTLGKELIGPERKSSWGRILRRYYRNPACRYIFWWRISSYLFNSDRRLSKRIAEKINRKITFKYGTEIELGAVIAPGITFAHHQGIVISRCAIIGENFHIRQNTTIGVKDTNSYVISIGDNVVVGANTCILGGNISIGSNVVIGAMSFINKDIPGNSVCYNRREALITVCEK